MVIIPVCAAVLASLCSCCQYLLGMPDFPYDGRNLRLDGQSDTCSQYQSCHLWSTLRDFSERKQSSIAISFNRILYFLKKSRRTRFLVLKNLYGGWPLAIHLYLNETKSLGWAGCPLLGSKRPPQCRSVAILQLAHSLPTYSKSD